MFPKQTNQIKNKLAYIASITACSVAILISVVIASQNAFTQDTWLHMAIGRYILEQRRVPIHSDISFKSVSPSLEWVSHSWISDLFLFLAVNANQRIGPFIIFLFTLGASIFLLYHITKHLALPKEYYLFTYSLASIGMLPFFRIHPLTFLPLLLLLLLYLYITYKTTHIPTSIYTIPFFVVLLANMNGGFLFLGILLILLYSGGFAIQSYLETKRFPFTHVGILIASVVSTFITPHGLRLHLYNLTTIGLLFDRRWFSTLAGSLEATNVSFVKIVPSPTLFIFTLLYSILIIIFICIPLIRNFQSSWKKIAPLLPTIPFVFLGYLWIRLIPVSIIVTIPLFLVAFHETITTLPIHHRIKTIIALLFSGLLFLYLGTLFFTRNLMYPTDIPKRQFDFIEKNSLSKKMLVSSDIAGYAYYRTYPEKGFLDAEDDMYDDHNAIAIFAGYSTISEEYAKALLSTYRFNSVLVSKENDYLTGYFSTNPEWTLVYLDYSGILFVRNTSVTDTFLSSHGLSALDFSLDLGVQEKNIPNAIEQLERFTKAEPTILAIGQLASLYRVSKNLTKAEKTLLRIPQDKWNYVIKTEMGRIKAGQGVCKQAETWFLSAISERDERNILRATFDLSILYAVCLNEPEKAKHYFKRYTSYPIPQTERERVTNIMKKFISTIEE